MFFDNYLFCIASIYLQIVSHLNDSPLFFEINHVSIFIYQQICDDEEQKPVFIVNVNNEQDVSKLYIAVQFNSKYMM